MQMHKVNTVTINGVEFLTRHWYMDSGELTPAERHRKFYGQFANLRVRNIVNAQFRGKVKRASMAKAYREGDTYLNECSALRSWDALNDCIRAAVGATYTQCCYADAPQGRVYWSLSDAVCVAKEAARLMIEAGEWDAAPKVCTTWAVRLHGELIDTVHGYAGDSADEVRRSLIEHDGYDPDIEVRDANE